MPDINEYLIKALYEQDFDKYNYDAIFYVEEEELYAHRDVLASASPVFKELFIKNRPTPDNPVNQPIRIDNYTYDEFWRFLRCIYNIYGNCERIVPHDDHIYPVIELAHIYRVAIVLERAGEHLGFPLGGFNNPDELDDDDIKDIFEKFETAYKYSMNIYIDDDQSVNFLNRHLSELLEYNDFVNLDKSTLKAFFNYNFHDTSIKQDEKLCKAIYKWGEHQAMVNDDMQTEEKNELVLHYIKDILPDLQYDQMSFKFLLKFALPKGLISADEAKNYTTVEVRVTCNGKTITGSFVDSYGIFKIIESNEDEKLIDRGDKKRCFWDKKFKILSIPSKLKKMKGVYWYLAFDINGKLNLKHYSIIKRTDYLLAEMKPEYHRESVSLTLDKNHEAFATVLRTY